MQTESRLIIITFVIVAMMMGGAIQMQQDMLEVSRFRWLTEAMPNLRPS